MDGMIILKWILKKQDGWVVGWIHMAPDRVQWRAFAIAVMNL
jgi:hypothetical protein